jgi:hypothetical protein
LPHFLTVATHDDDAGVVKLRHSADANGKTTKVEVISESQGYQMGDYLKKALPLLDLSMGGRPPRVIPYLVVRSGRWAVTL